MKALVKSIIPIMLIIACFNSCSKEDSDCANQFCLDTLSNTESDLANYPVIDVHQHVYSSNEPWWGADHPDFETPASNDQYFQDMVNNMIDNNVVLCLAGNPLRWITYCYENYAQYNHLFKYGVSFFDYNDLKNNLKTGKVSQGVKDGVIGSVGELSNVYYGKPHDDSLLQKVYAIADSFSFAVVTHMGTVPVEILTPSYLYEAGNPLSLKSTLETWPNVNVCAAHFCISNDAAYNFDSDTRSMLKNYKNFYVDVSPLIWYDDYSKQKVEELIIQAVNDGLEDKILYGTDAWYWPEAINYSIERVKNADYLTATQKKKILYWNAARFLKLSNEEVKAHFAYK